MMKTEFRYLVYRVMCDYGDTFRMYTGYSYPTEKEADDMCDRMYKNGGFDDQFIVVDEETSC